ncbi:unnamed protein product [Ceratitis capitata]|uniref:(Mediterranean fruit fly) hypothetical protein n=2 Tax=Ceratitis capitata TaxID=7213 RepID=A0A811V6Q9_CERCA|nr:unnamed protein product [Ceratitis capitata]
MTKHINAIATLFSSYKINKPAPISGAPVGPSGSNTTLENKPKNKAGPKSMHISRKANTTLGPRRLGTNSPQSVANSLSPMRNQSSSPVTTERTNSPVTIAPEIAADQKLSKKCVVILQENEEVIKYKRQEVAFINSLLEKQREMQRERALKRQEFQNILKQKRDEGKRLMAEIAEIKRQQAEANEAQQVQKRSHPMLQQQSSTLLNRKRLLVKERNVKFNTKPKVRSRSTTPNRKPNESEDEVDRAENEAEINGIDATQGVIGVAFDLVANNKTPIETAAEEVSAVEKDTKITETQNKKLNSAKRLYAEASNTKISSLKVQNQSTKASSQDVQTNTEMHNELAITTTHTLIKAQTTSVKDVTFMPEEISTTNNTILTGKPKLNAPSTLPIRIEHTRYARSMTPMNSVEAPTAAPSVQTVENDLPSKANFSFSSPLTSRPRLARAPSLSPSIFSRRNRVKVRRSMQDPSSNTDFPTNAVSWLSNASTRTKAVKVRLKRLQHFNINATPPSSPEKVHTDKAPKSMRPASAMPAFFEVHETNATPTEVLTHPENPLEAVANKNERVQSFKGKGEEKLLEMDEKYGVNVRKTVENVLLVAPNQVSPSRPSLKTVQTRVNKGVRRKPQRKIQQGSKKLKLTEKLNNLDNNSATLTNTDESAEKVQCASKKETKGKVVDSAIAGCAKTSQDMGNPSEAEVTNVQQPEENGEKQQEIVLEVQNEMHTPMDVVVVSVCEESIAKGPMENASMEIDCTDSKTKRNPTHGAVVTQVVDVTPGRHIKKRVLGDLLLATNTPKSTQFASNEVFNTELNLTCTEKSSADLELPEKVIEACTPPINSDTLSIVNPNSTIPPPPIDTGCQVINEDTTNVNKFELQNVNDDTPPPTSLALPKASKPVSSESILCNMQFDVDPTTAIGLQNNMHENNEITPNESGKTTENAMPTTAADQNVLDSLPNAGARCLTEDEESSSDCLLSQLSERVQKMKELESIVDATTVHVIKEATMTLMSFEVAPTLPAYLLNGESRDVPTPPAISTRAPTPTGKNDAAAEIGPIEPTATSKPVLIESLVKEMPQTSQTADAKVLTQKSVPKPKNDSTNAIVPLQEAEIVTDNTIPLVAPEVQVKFDERLSSNHLSPPLSQEQQIAEIINSPTPASAISTSDHEVSSTQEIVYASSKRSNANAVNKSVDLPFSASIEEEAAMVVQNSQIDTTHHLPENSYYMRKRSRKFSDEFTMCENRIENVNNKDALRQRRKTFSSESCLSAAQFVTNNAIFPIHANTLTVGSATAASTSTNLSSVGGNSGGSSPSTTTEPVIKPPPARRRNHTHTKRNNSQSPLSARSRMAAGDAGELNGSFVYNCSHLQSPKANIADVERCVVLPASAVVPPVNLGNISRTYSKNNMAQIKVFVPPDAEMCLQNEDGEKDSYVATTTSKRGRSVSAVNRNRNKKPNIPNTAPNKSKGKTPVSGSKKRNTVNNAQKPENTKSSKATAVAKAPTTRAKNVERTSNKKRK